MPSIHKSHDEIQITVRDEGIEFKFVIECDFVSVFLSLLLLAHFHFMKNKKQLKWISCMSETRSNGLLFKLKIYTYSLRGEMRIKQRGKKSELFSAAAWHLNQKRPLLAHFQPEYTEAEEIRWYDDVNLVGAVLRGMHVTSIGGASERV